MRVKKWFRDKNFSEQESFIIGVADLEILKETEKAYYFEAVSDYGSCRFWCPKSCTQTEEEYEAEQNEQYARILKGEKYHNLLVKFAKDNGIKGIRKTFRTETLKRKIEEAGLKVPTYEELNPTKEQVEEESKENTDIEKGDTVETAKGIGTVELVEDGFVLVKLDNGEETSFRNIKKYVKKLDKEEKKMAIDEAYEVWDILTEEYKRGDCLSSLRYYASEFCWGKRKSDRIYQAIKSDECSDYLIEVLSSDYFDEKGFLKCL